MMKKLVLVSLLISLSSCAGLISGKSQNVFLRTSDGSEDVKAEVSSVTGPQEVLLPTTVYIPRNKNPLTIKVLENKCFKKTKTYVNPEYNPMLAANLLGGLLGLTGTTIDMNSGAAWEYEKNVVVNVKKKRSCRR